MNKETCNLIIELRQSEQPQTIAPASERTTKTIVLYSPNMGLCVSLQIAFEDRYNMLTTTDSEMLMTLVESLGPDLVIIDALPSLNLRKCFAKMKREHPQLRILLFISSRLHNPAVLGSLFPLINAVVCQPITLTEFQRRIISLFHE